ncbi:MAG: cysteine desulfurase family protein [Thermoguttaceae bacterium]
MIGRPVYMDNHATTRVDPRVLEAMLPWFGDSYGNPASSGHWFGWEARQAVQEARESIAAAIGAKPQEVVFTSGATESNNLAIRGVAERAGGGHLLSVLTEHPSVLEPLERLARRGFGLTLLPVQQAPSPQAGLLVVEQLEQAIRPDTILVSVMLANNEIGVVQPLERISRVCRDRGVLLHSDATQAVGKIPVDVDRLGVDLMSFTAHKLYGPKGIGALYVRHRSPPIRLEPLIHGGGHERNLRSGTLNVPGIVGFARALQLCLDEMPQEQPRLRALRDRLYQGLLSVPETRLNGPALLPPEWRLAGNLNVSFAGVDGESLLASMKDLATSTGSACTSARPEPSHVLRALGLPDQLVRGSLRFGLGRFNTEEEVEFAIRVVRENVLRLRTMPVLPRIQ